MQAELQARLEQLGDDLRAGRIDRAALFWLKVFADASAPAGQLRRIAGLMPAWRPRASCRDSKRRRWGRARSWSFAPVCSALCA